IVDVAEVGAADYAFTAGGERSLARIGRDVVILGEMIERSAGQDRQLGVPFGNQRGSGRNGAVPTSDQNSLGTALDRFLEPRFQIRGLYHIEFEAQLAQCFTRRFGVAALRVEEGFEFGAGSGRWEAGGGKRQKGRGKREE